jgi:cell division initiation protein
MIDLTPLDVRKKRGDFKKSMRGYDTQEVDTFLDLVAERMEELVKEAIGLRERSERLQVQVDAQSGREKAVQDALVTAQTMREEMKEQSRREADLARREAEVEARKLLGDADRRLEERRAAVEDLERKRARFLRSFRSLLERELDMVVVEEGRSPLDDNAVELELSGGRSEPSEGNGVPEPGEGDGDGGAAAAPRRTGVPRPGELWLSGLGESSDVPRPED